MTLMQLDQNILKFVYKKRFISERRLCNSLSGLIDNIHVFKVIKKKGIKIKRIEFKILTITASPVK